GTLACRARAPRNRLVDGISGAGRATPHALTMVAVTGKGVDPAKLRLGLGEGLNHSVENAGKAPGAFLGCGRSRAKGGRLVHCPFPEYRRLRAKTLAPAEDRRFAWRKPVPFQFLVEPHHRQRTTLHVEAGDIFPDLGRDEI